MAYSQSESSQPHVVGSRDPGTYRASHAALPSPDARAKSKGQFNRRVAFVGAVATAAWTALAAIVGIWPNYDDFPETSTLAWLSVVLAAVLFFATISGSRRHAEALADARIGAITRVFPWAIALAVVLSGWEVVTAKLGLLPRPFFAPPQALLDVFRNDYIKLGTSLLYSLRLLFLGYVAGAMTGFVVGVGVGWSRIVGYWVHPILRIIGPLPATAWLPLAFFFFPSSFSASIFLIALASGFPVAVLTWSGVASVNPAFYDIARTLGGKPWFLVLRVAVPAALPSVFVGLFMGLGASFSVLVVAEMMGVKAGLGFYLQWAQGWAAYANMYAALLVMALMCSGLITLLFAVRGRLLVWQKGLLKW
ncbi:ABC transporter permease [Robbsia andropogonis]|uniref:ABC transporter permease n=1 Tax=Robbsia andropogonis TaxID=28092 RepID=UPI0004678DC1|nr:ABC transporter permease subunit [Robbsia andropogonis]MCP1119106.1 ABC transporter permease subunit [Robbsia andropogonis]MCP1129043.1 ABC transporter permease subunit [Robbsia andropogonis]